MTFVDTTLFVLAVVGAIASVWFVIERLFPIWRLSWRHAQQSATKIAEQMEQKAFSPTLIVGIGRGGAIIGAFISGCLGHRPLVVIDRKYVWMEGRRIDDLVLHMQFPPALLEKVLLVAGEAHSGNTMRLYWEYFMKLGAKEVHRAVYYLQKGSTEPIEYVGYRSNKELKMPWMFSRLYVRDSRSEEEANALRSFRGSMATESTKTCYFVRHGESTDNEGGDRYSGITECLLTEKGLSQADSVGRYLQTEGIQRIFSSPMKRAIATARRIQAITGGELIVDRRLREIDFGEWEGMTRKEVNEKWRDAYERYKQNPLNNPPVGGESPAKVLDRICEFWQEIQHTPSMLGISKFIVISHNAVTRIFITNLVGIGVERYRERRIDNASITKLMVNQMGETSIVYENKTDHLV